MCYIGKLNVFESNMMALVAMDTPITSNPNLQHFPLPSVVQKFLEKLPLEPSNTVPSSGTLAL